jgi:PAS domain S-box-containing protein/prepilin-type processing-associated H-X9-DG protein
MPTDRLARPAGVDRPATETRVLLLAPTARDGDVSCRLLASVGIPCQLCGDVDQLCDVAAAGAGAVMLPEELVLNGGAECLAEHLRHQPVWSDLPVVVLSRTGGDPRAVDQAMATLGNVSVVERPVRVNTLLSVVRTALRARERQYQVRDHLLAERRSAAALRASEERLALAVAAAELGTFHCPVPLGRPEWNDTCKAQFWLPPDAAVDGDLFFARLHPDDRARARAAIEATVFGRQPFDGEYRTVSPDGRQRWVRAKGKAYYDPAGRPTRFDGISLDVTEQKRAEADLRDARTRLEATLAAGEVATWVWDIARDRVVADRNLADLFGIADADMGGAPLSIYVRAIHPDDRARVAATIEASLAGGVAFEAEYRVTRPDGSVRSVLARGRVERDDAGVAVRLPGVVLDITDRVRAEEERQRLSAELARQSQVFDALLSSISDPAYIIDRAGRFQFANRPLLALWNRTPEQAVGRSFAELDYPPHLTARLMADVETVFRTGRTVTGEVEYASPNGAVGRYEHAFAPVFAADGSVELIAGSSRDTTARAELEAARERALAGERSARAEAERQGRMKDEFLATLSHELRTPLNAILGWTQILRAGVGPPDPEDLAEGLATIERNARAQTQIIEDLLDMSRVISGKMHLDVRPVDPVAVVRDAADTVRPAAAAKGVDLTVTVTGRSPAPMTGDPHRLGQVFWNLFSNAVKFTPKGGRIDADVSWADGHVRVRIGDTGEGIRPDFLPYVFDRFRQDDASTTRRHGGLGLGLAIVRQLVELHGGRVRAESDGPGRGTTFIVELPLAAVAAEPAAPGPQPPSRPAAADTAALAAARRRLVGLRVLAVDDEPDARAVLRRLLEANGAVVRTAGSAAEAMGLLAAEVPDVLVSDIGMPGEDGYALVARLRRRPPDAGGTVPAIALTAYARAADRARALSAGFDAHLVKPVDPADLVLAVAAAVAARPLRLVGSR